MKSFKTCFSFGFNGFEFLFHFLFHIKLSGIALTELITQFEKCNMLTANHNSCSPAHTFGFSTKYRLFAGLWFGRKKPDFRTFLQPFVNSLHGLFKEGT